MTWRGGRRGHGQRSARGGDAWEEVRTNMCKFGQVRSGNECFAQRMARLAWTS